MLAGAFSAYCGLLRHVELRVLQNLLNEVSKISYCHGLYFLVIQQKLFTLGKHPTVICVGCFYVTSLPAKIMLVITATNLQMIQVSKQESIVEAYKVTMKCMYGFIYFICLISNLNSIVDVHRLYLLLL